MTGAAAYQIWERAVLATVDFRVQSSQGLPQGFERLGAAIDVLVQLKLVLIDAVTTREEGFLGRIAGELSALQRELCAWPDQSLPSPVGEDASPSKKVGGGKNR